MFLMNSQHQFKDYVEETFNVHRNFIVGVTMIILKPILAL